MKYSYIILFLLVSGIIAFAVVFNINKNRTLKELPKHYFLEQKKTLKDVGLPDIKLGESIPKLIHRTHENKEILELFKEEEDIIKQKNHDFEIINYTEEDREKFIKQHYNNRVQKAYKSINSKYGNTRADFFKFLVIYIKGGVYVDVKSGPIKKINKMLEKAGNKMIVSRDYPLFSWYWHTISFPYGENILWSVVAPPGHPVIKELISRTVTNIERDYRKDKIYTGGLMSCLCIAGPIMYTLITNKKENEKHIKFMNYNYNGYMKKFIQKEGLYDSKRDTIKKLGAPHYVKLSENIVEEYKQDILE